MTSSLVGSEMCIRDSLYPQHRHHHRGPRLTPLGTRHSRLLFQHLLRVPGILVLPASRQQINGGHITFHGSGAFTT
eukprot:3808421-Prorocentrum_lima.AAC.1